MVFNGRCEGDAEVGEIQAVIRTCNRCHLQPSARKRVEQASVEQSGAETAEVMHADVEPKVAAFKRLRQATRLRMAFEHGPGRVRQRCRCGKATDT